LENSFCRQLNKLEVTEIAEIMLKEVFGRLTEKGIVLEVTDRFKDRLITEGYSPSYGASPLHREIMRLLEDSLAEEILSGRIKDGDTALVDVDENGIVQVSSQQTRELLTPVCYSHFSRRYSEKCW
jgi:ATP-dependent Clp protease ATP-binding subunit ClpC